MRLVTLLLLDKRFYSFGEKFDQPILELITSRWCHFSVPVAIGTNYTVPTGCEVSFDGVNWTDAGGVTESLVLRWRCRQTSSPYYLEPKTVTPTMDSVEYPFTVTTLAAPTGEGETQEDGVTPWNQEDGTPFNEEG